MEADACYGPQTLNPTDLNQDFKESFSEASAIPEPRLSIAASSYECQGTQLVQITKPLLPISA